MISSTSALMMPRHVGRQLPYFRPSIHRIALIFRALDFNHQTGRIPGTERLTPPAYREILSGAVILDASTKDTVLTTK